MTDTITVTREQVEWALVTLLDNTALDLRAFTNLGLAKALTISLFNNARAREEAEKAHG